MTEDVVLRAREMSQSSSILKCRQIVWMMLDYFKTNSTLQEQYKYQDIESLKWMGDEELEHFYNIWKLIATGMAAPLNERILCDISMDRIRPSNQLQADIHEFDRMRDDDPRQTLRWLTGSIHRLLQRERMLSASALQTKRIQSGVSSTADDSSHYVAPAF
ncbi:MAG: hypothetical protein ACKPKO_52660 [Candidatus Fonsibacter sp.]